MKKAMVLTIILILFFGYDTAFAVEKKSPSVFRTKELDNSTNIHYTGKYCQECHRKVPGKGNETILRYDGDYKILCRCHNNTQGAYLHPVNITLSKEKKSTIPTEFPLQNGKITCLTCHDIYLQCRKSVLKESSLRGAPYQKRTDICYQCHDANKYKMLDPHIQIDKTGSIVVEKCLYCHVEKPNEKEDQYEDLKLIGDLAILCQRCHAISGNHSGNFNHMVKPSAKGMKKMETMKKKFEIILPLDENGKMTCITCHNPHEKGVIPKNMPSAKGASEKFKHRLPGKLCLECHQM